MTLTLKNRSVNLPVIRQPNFTDLTWDVPIDQIPLVVGNELDDTEQVRYSITLKEYLSQFKSYLTDPRTCKVRKFSYLFPRKFLNFFYRETTRAYFPPVNNMPL